MSATNRPTFDSLRKTGDLKSIDALTAEEISLLQDDLRERESALANDKEFFKNILKDRFGVAVASAYTAKGEDTGTVRFDIGDGLQIKAEKKKSVSWDQTKLAAMWKRIADAKDQPEVYIQRTETVTYNIAENTYKNWPEQIQNAFKEARTVSAGKPDIKIEPKKQEK